MGASSKLLFRANRARQDPTVASPYDLWKLADRQAASSSDRVEAYGHAMLHAGYIVAKATGKPYTVCPVCEEQLAA